MGYRSDGLRAWKQTSSGVRTYFLYDGAALLHEMSSSGTVTATDTWGADGLVSRYAGNPAFYAYTPGGNVADVTGLGSTTPTAQEYDAYGVAVAGGGASPYGYGAQWGDYTDTQTGLVLCTYRYYDPANGRFINRDPIGQDGGVNLYAYVGNNPVHWIDPWGLQEEPNEPNNPGGMIGPGEGGVGDIGPSEGTPIMGEGYIDVPPTETPESVLEGGEKPYLWKNSDGTKVYPPSQNEGSQPNNHWGRPGTLPDHFDRHGPDFNANTEDEYANMAHDFYNNKTSPGLETKVTPDGVTRVYDPATNTFGSYNPDGTTKTFYKPTSPTYWQRQPGTLTCC